MIVAAAPVASEQLDRANVIHVIQGESRISDDPSDVLTTILGSCVAACLFDREAGVGGMNHFLLPGEGACGEDDMRYGVNAMELLINGVLRVGARRERLRVKLFGGARIVAGLTDIGAKNAAFACDFIKTEGLIMEGASLGGDYPRRVQFWPASGRARQIRPAGVPWPLLQTESAGRKPFAPPQSGDLELF